MAFENKLIEYIVTFCNFAILIYLFAGTFVAADLKKKKKKDTCILQLTDHLTDT